MKDTRILKRGKRKRILLIIAAAVFIFIFTLSLIFIDNKNVDYEDFSVNADNIENGAAAGLKIAHLSDLHFPRIKVNIDGLLERVEEENVDFIAVTGDIIDRGADVNSCGIAEFIEKVVRIAPVYYVNGNHEKDHPQENNLYEILSSAGVTVLENESVNVSFGSKRITIAGLTDNADYGYNFIKDNPEIRKNYKVLLAHRPEKWTSYIAADNKIPPHLILTGHAHGGQFRFFGKGLVAPDQGFFPKFDSGLYAYTGSNYYYETAEDTYSQTINMIVSRGVGNSIIPFRFNNKPHVPVITVSF